MKINQLKKLVESHGAKLECDSGGRFEVWQCCSPTGKVWECNSAKCIRVEWVPGCATSAEYSSKVIVEAAECVRLGLRDMTPQERFECAED